LKALSVSADCRALVGLCLIATLATACSFDASRLRASASPTPDGAVEHIAAPDASAPDSNGGTTAWADALAGMLDAPAGAGGSDTPAATGGVGGGDGPTETGGMNHGDAPTAMGGANGGDASQATGGTGAGGTAGTNDSASSTGGMDAVADSGGSIGGGSSGGATPVEGGIGGTGGAGSGGQTNAGGSNGGVTDGAADAASSDGGVAGGQAGAGGSGGGGVGGMADAAASDGGICVAQCPPTATIGITGPWGATFSNGSSGTVVTSGDAVFSTWLTSRGPNCVVQNLDISGNNYLTAARLAPYQIIVVLDIYHTQADKNAFFNAKLTNTGYPAYPGTQRTILASEANAVRDWVNNGGGLMTTIGTAGSAAEMTNANLLLNPFGIAYSVTDVNVLPGNSTITTFSTAPPIASQITAGVNTLRVTGAVGIEGLAGGSLPLNSSTFSLYASGGATGRGGYVTYALGVAKVVGGTGRINVWGDETITYDSSWNSSAFQTQTYWNNVFTWLGQCP
jgi:hypothetical protein